MLPSSQPPANTPNIWLAGMTSRPLTEVWIAAALRRGIKEEILQDGFRISGLGQLVEAGIDNDRLVVFGD